MGCVATVPPKVAEGEPSGPPETKYPMKRSWPARCTLQELPALAACVISETVLSKSPQKVAMSASPYPEGRMTTCL